MAACWTLLTTHARAPMPEFSSRERTVGEVLALLAGSEPERPQSRGKRAGRRRQTAARSGAARAPTSDHDRFAAGGWTRAMVFNVQWLSSKFVHVS